MDVIGKEIQYTKFMYPLDMEAPLILGRDSWISVSSRPASPDSKSPSLTLHPQCMEMQLLLPIIKNIFRSTS